ncbi:hypothetical protein [Sphingomonas sp. KC8]|uniref:hypothetical protein n=1 Tax=Sphingomonas sp. KC8 TaxID=1030157 RepID=UPI0002488F0C|nr:hypothetical protein [Sphingomonas sp. KC8]
MENRDQPPEMRIAPSPARRHRRVPLPQLRHLPDEKEKYFMVNDGFAKRAGDDPVLRKGSS